MARVDAHTPPTIPEAGCPICRKPGCPGLSAHGYDVPAQGGQQEEAHITAIKMALEGKPVVVIEQRVTVYVPVLAGRPVRSRDVQDV